MERLLLRETELPGTSVLADSPSMVLPLRGIVHARALQYDPTHRRLYWIDWAISENGNKRLALYRANDDGKKVRRQLLLSSCE